MAEVKLFAAYAIFVVGLIVLLRRERLPKLPASLYAPLAWIVICLSRSLSQWLQTRADFQVRNTDLEGNSLDAVFLSVLIFIGLRTLYRRRLDLAGLIKDNKALFALYGLALISLLWADVPLIVFKRWLKWSGSLVMVLVILTETDPRAAVRSIVKRCAFSLIPLSVLFIKFVPRMGRSFTLSGGADLHGVATQKNEYGLLLMIFGIYFAWELIVLWRSKDHAGLQRIGIIDAFFLAVILWQLILIDSKTPMLCLFLAIGILFLIGHPHFKGSPRRVRNAIIGLVIAAALLQYFADIKGTIIVSARRNPTLTDRTVLWGEILKVPINPWLGTGWDNFWLPERVAPIWEKWRWRPRSAHNGYIETYLFLGWSGIALLLFVLLAGFRRSLGRFRSDLEGGGLSLAFFFAIILQNYAESSFHRLSPIWLFFMLLCMIKLPGNSRAPDPAAGGPSS
ncbi:MAG: O-antigen ligase family protein [Acidobacteria bacterium]|nr:O-antigen ligase family protein [Acidobacteriota bacterium]